MVTWVFTVLPSGIRALVGRLLDHRVSAAVTEATGIWRENVYAALHAALIRPLLVHAQYVKQLKGRKADLADSSGLARICHSGHCKPSLVPPAHFRAIRRSLHRRAAALASSRESARLSGCGARGGWDSEDPVRYRPRRRRSGRAAATERS